MTNKEEQQCRKAFETVNQGVLSFKTYEKYRGFRLCWDYILTNRKKELDLMLQGMYNESIEHLELTDEELNDLKQTEYMKSKGGIK